MQVNRETIVELFQVLLNLVKKKGAKETLKVLRSLNEDVDIEDEFAMKVVKTVCDEFAINVNDVINEKYIRGDNKYAIGFCLHYLYHDNSIGEIQKKGIFKYKDKSVLSRYRQMVERLDAKHKADLPYVKIKDKLDKKIEELKK